MPAPWKSELITACEKVLRQGGEVTFIVVKRQQKRYPIIMMYIANQTVCDEETLMVEED